MANGFNPKLQETKTWVCSDVDNEMYFYDSTKNEDYFEDYSYNYDDLIHNALSNAQVSAAIQGSTCDSLVVFELEVDDNLCDDDESCGGMEDSATTVQLEDLSVNLIKNIYISYDAYNPSLRFFYLQDCFRNHLLNSKSLSSLEYKACELISTLEYLDETSEFTWDKLI